MGSTSFFVAASNTLCGTAWMITSLNVVWVFDNSAPASTLADDRFTPRPGLSTFTVTSPTTSASVVTISKYRMERNASLPTRFMSSPCPAMPTTSVENSSGTINDLIMRRNTVDRSWRSVASNPLCAGLSGKKCPASTPRIMEITIHCVCVMRRRPVFGGVGAAEVGVSADM